jgi:hypothetical protein
VLTAPLCCCQVTALVPLITGVVDFFANHFGANSTTLSLFPTQSLETWQCVTFPAVVSDCVTNDLPTIAGLTYLLRRLLSEQLSAVLPSSLVAACKQLQARLPELPMHNGELWPGQLLPAGTTNSYVTHAAVVAGCVSTIDACRRLMRVDD